MRRRVIDAVLVMVVSGVVFAASAQAARFDPLWGVSCPQAVGCVAVGDADPGFVPGVPGGRNALPLTEQLSGGSWSARHMVDDREPFAMRRAVLAAVFAGAMATSAQAASQDLVYGVSCPRAASCVAVGGVAVDGTSEEQPLTAQLSGGSWTTIPSATLPHGGQLTQVACPAEGTCEAVGTDYFGAPLVERLTGGGWQRQTIPASVSAVDDVSCVDASWCMAVGDGSFRGTFAIRFDGRRWTRLAVPVTPTAPLPYEVSCASRAFCMLAGIAQGNRGAGDLLPMAAKFDGRVWRRTPVPGAFALNDVSCPAPGECYAVGVTVPARGLGHAAVVRYSHSRWTVMTDPGARAEGTDLARVSCSGSGACVATGYAQVGGFAQVLAGGRWSATAAEPGAQQAGLSCWAAAACVAVDGPTGAAQLSGGAWSVLPSP
jgi:hypothetical protein